MKRLKIKLERKRHQRIRAHVLHQALRWGSAVVGIIILASFGTAALIDARVFRVEHLKISATEHVKPYQIRSVFERARGSHLLSLDPSPMIREMMDLAWVGEVRVRKLFPDTLMIQVTERVPAAVVENGRDLHWVDASGVILGSARGNDEALPRMKGVSVSGLLRRDTEQIHRLRSGLSLLELIAEGDDRWREEDPVVLDLSGGHSDPKLYLDGYRIRFGEGGFHRKWKSFLMVQEDLRARGLAPEEVDLRFSDQVVVKTF